MRIIILAFSAALFGGFCGPAFAAGAAADSAAAEAPDLELGEEINITCAACQQ